MRVFEYLIAVTAAGVLLAPGALAQDRAVREAQVRAQRAIAKVEQEKTALAQEKDELAAKLSAAIRGQSALKADASRSRERAAAADKELVLLRKEHAELKLRLAESERQSSQASAQCREAQQTAVRTQQRLETERTDLAARLKQESLAAQTCVDTNNKLHGLARELIKQYQKNAAGKTDPVFGLDLVKIENRMQDYRDKVDELKLLPPRKP